MTIKQFIEKAIEGGWKHPDFLDFEQIDEKREEIMFWGDGTHTDRISIYKFIFSTIELFQDVFKVKASFFTNCYYLLIFFFKYLLQLIWV